MKAILFSLFAAFLLVGCGTTKTVTVTETVYRAAKVDDAMFALPAAPKPLVAEDFKGKSTRENYVLFGNKSLDLYSHIAILEDQILKIKKSQDSIATRIEKDSTK